jgi:hypothetical protein
MLVAVNQVSVAKIRGSEPKVGRPTASSQERKAAFYRLSIGT